MVQKGDNMSLTKKELENAYHISREIQDIERQIERLTKKSGIVSDIKRRVADKSARLAAQKRVKEGSVNE